MNSFPEPSTTDNEISGIATKFPKKKRFSSVTWADQELMSVVEFTLDPFPNETTGAVEILSAHNMAHGSRPNERNHRADDIDELPLIQDLIDRTTTTINSTLKGASSESPKNDSESNDDDDARMAALSDLITHLEDTAALLKDYLAPPSLDKSTDFISEEQTNFLIRYQVVLVLFSQVVSILLLTLFDHLTGDGDTGYIILTRATGTVLQILNTIIVIFCTVILSKQMLKYKVEGSFLAQTYLATVITFAGLYFMIYRFQEDSWEFGSTDKMEESIAVVQYIKMLYLSVSAATLCGAANIQPRSWYVVLLLCFQSLVNFVYFASILAQTIGNYHSYTVQVRRSSSISRTGYQATQTGSRRS